MAEWTSMRDREKQLGIADGDRPQGLIYPILFSDSESFPDEARYRSWVDFKPWNVPDLVLQGSPDWIGFHRQVTALAIDLARLLPQVPDWQSGWPIDRPNPPLRPPARIPRFDR
jgi:hypothetical protein